MIDFEKHPFEVCVQIRTAKLEKNWEVNIWVLIYW
jgi:hypothetical protein